MHHTVTDWDDFATRWGGPLNFRLAGASFPFAFDLPPLPEIVDALRNDSGTRITPGTRGDRLNLTDIRDDFVGLPLAEAMASPFALAHFSLQVFDVPGGFLEGFHARVVTPWHDALRAHGFSWQRCYPIVFVSGAGCATNYHMDFSHVLAWQRYGVKRFCGLRDPDRWAPRDVRRSYQPPELDRPAALTDDDALCCEMRPGDLLWNAMLTPHWVEASEGVALSINIAHHGLRLHGQLCRNGRELSPPTPSLASERGGRG